MWKKAKRDLFSAAINPDSHTEKPSCEWNSADMERSSLIRFLHRADEKRPLDNACHSHRRGVRNSQWHKDSKLLGDWIFHSFSVSVSVICLNKNDHLLWLFLSSLLYRVALIISACFPCQEFKLCNICNMQKKNKFFIKYNMRKSFCMFIIFRIQTRIQVER